MALSFEKQNEKVIGWADGATQRMKSNATAMGVQHRSGSPSPFDSLSRLNNRVRYRDEAISMISFRFPRSLVWTHKGAGKGIGGSKGSRWVDKYGNQKSTNPDSLGKIGTGSRRQKEFINETLEASDGVDELATIVAQETGDAITSNLFIK